MMEKGEEEVGPGERDSEAFRLYPMASASNATRSNREVGVYTDSDSDPLGYAFA